MLFVTTLEMTESLTSWINQDADLKQLGVERLSSIRKIMQQKVIIATTANEEGLDLRPCNLVIRYEHVTCEIAYVHARGNYYQTRLLNTSKLICCFVHKSLHVSK